MRIYFIIYLPEMVSVFFYILYIRNYIPRGSGRKAYMDGYRVGGKTGTAQIAENGVYLQGQYILSFIGAVPMNDPKIAIYVCMEKPHSLIQYGGTIVGPIVNNIMKDVVTYLDIKKQDNELEFEYTWMDIKTHEVPNYVNMNVKNIKSQYFKFVKVGDGDIVISQLPKEKEIIKEGNEIILFT